MPRQLDTSYDDLLQSTKKPECADCANFQRKIRGMQTDMAELRSLLDLKSIKLDSLHEDMRAKDRLIQDQQRLID